MRIRTMFVGVDDHIDPYTARPILRYVAANWSHPTGGQGRPPLQDVLRFRRWFVQFCNCASPGRCGHRPLQGFCVVAVWLCVLRLHSAQAEQSPSPTLRRNVAAAQKVQPFPSSVRFADSFPPRGSHWVRCKQRPKAAASGRWCSLYALPIAFSSRAMTVTAVCTFSRLVARFRRTIVCPLLPNQRP